MTHLCPIPCHTCAILSYLWKMRAEGKTDPGEPGAPGPHPPAIALRRSSRYSVLAVV